MARAGRFDEALEACAAAETEPGLMLNEPDDEDERVRTATVATFVRNLAIAGDDDTRNHAEAVADDE